MLSNSSSINHSPSECSEPPVVSVGKVRIISSKNKTACSHDHRQIFDTNEGHYASLNRQSHNSLIIISLSTMSAGINAILVLVREVIIIYLPSSFRSTSLVVNRGSYSSPYPPSFQPSPLFTWTIGAQLNGPSNRNLFNTSFHFTGCGDARSFLLLLASEDGFIKHLLLGSRVCTSM